MSSTSFQSEIISLDGQIILLEHLDSDVIGVKYLFEKVQGELGRVWVWEFGGGVREGEGEEWGKNDWSFAVETGLWRFVVEKGWFWQLLSAMKTREEGDENQKRNYMVKFCLLKGKFDFSVLI